MGLFGGGNSSSSNTSNTSNVVNDSRVAVADSGTYIGGGAVVTTTNTQNNIDNSITYAADADALKAISADLVSGTKYLADQAFTTSHDLMKEATRLSSESVSANERVSRDAIDASRQTSRDAIDFARANSADYYNASRALNNLVNETGDENRTFATGLVDQVLARSQSADQQNYEKTLDLLKWVAVAAAAAIAIPFIMKGARA